MTCITSTAHEDLIELSIIKPDFHISVSSPVMIYMGIVRLGFLVIPKNGPLIVGCYLQKMFVYLGTHRCLDCDVPAFWPAYEMFPRILAESAGVI